MKIGVLGGGLAGLSLSYFLQERGHEVEVLEKEVECGGLCRSFSHNGFSFDLGGHIIFSKDKSILALMVKLLGENVKKHYRNNTVWFKGRQVKYPFENGLAALDKADNFTCLYGFINNKNPRPKNFRQWLYYTFGNGLAEKYLIPYNEKIWNCKTDQMGLEWVERVPKPPLEDIVKSALGIETEGYTHQLYFYYPVQGGIQALVKAFETKLKTVIRGHEVLSIRRHKKKWLVDGREYDKIISCLPLFDLIAALEQVPSQVKKAVKSLRFNSLSVVMLGIDKENLSDKFAVYVPQRDLLFHRICFHSYLGDSYVPKRQSSVVAEITTNPGDGVHELSDQELIEHVAWGLDKEGLIDRKTVCESAVRKMKYGYVVYDLQYQQKMRLIRKYIKSLGLPLCGRFAEFEYLNMDAVICRALDLANKITAGRVKK